MTGSVWSAARRPWGTALAVAVALLTVVGGGWTLAQDPADATPLLLVQPRTEHAATLLPDGRVLLTGGQGEDGTGLTTAEIVDPVNGTVTPTGTLLVPRLGHSATLLADGTVLVAGGASDVDALRSTEILDPTSGASAAGPRLRQARLGHVALAMPDGNVVLVGGRDEMLATSERYDPAAGTLTPLPRMRALHSTALALPDGCILATGEPEGSGPRAELYDPAGNRWSRVRGLIDPRSDHTATLLPDGRVLLAGGWGGEADLASAELLSPVMGGPS